MNLNKRLNDYLEEISSGSPTPGGGNVSAFSGALACSLGMMVCNLTIGKRKYAAVEEDFREYLYKLELYKTELLQLAQKDNEAFDLVMEAFKLPKETDEQKEIRSRKIDEATFEATKTPADVIEVCSKTLPLLQSVLEKGNQNSLSDAGVAISLLGTAAQGAFYNVLINCSVLNKGHEDIGKLLHKAETLYNSISTACKNLSQTLTNKLGDR